MISATPPPKAVADRCATRFPASGSASLTLTSDVQVTVTPATASVPVSTTQQFTAQIAGSAAVEVLCTLIERGSPNLRFVISTRCETGLPLGRIRAHHEMLELGAQDLRFREDETLVDAMVLAAEHPAHRSSILTGPAQGPAQTRAPPPGRSRCATAR